MIRVLRALAEDAERRRYEAAYLLLWVLLERQASVEYAHERVCADWIDIGGEA